MEMQLSILLQKLYLLCMHKAVFCGICILSTMGADQRPKKHKNVARM